MTEFEIASAIENYVTSSQGVTDSPISLRQIRDEMDTLRIRMMAQADGQSQLLPPYENFLQYQTIETFVDTVKKVRYIEIPRLFYHNNGKPAIGYLGSKTYKTPYKVVTGRQHRSIFSDRFIKDDPIAFVNNTRIEFYNVTPEVVQLDAVYEKPREVSGYDYKKSNYPIPYHFIDQLIGKTAESYIRTHYRIGPQPNTQSDIPNAKRG